MNYYKREGNTITMFDDKGNPIMAFQIPENNNDYQTSMIPVLVLDDDKVKQMPYTTFKEIDS